MKAAEREAGARGTWGDPYGVLCCFVGGRGCREWLTAPPVINRSSLRDAGEERAERSGRGCAWSLRDAGEERPRGMGAGSRGL